MFSFSNSSQQEELQALRASLSAEIGTEAPQPVDPTNNPSSPEKIALGEALFFDPNLSSCGNIACASCHIPEKGFSDAEQVSDGCQGATGRRNSNTIYNSAFASHLFWDGRVQTLEEQALGPVVDPAEMANTWDNVLQYLKTGVHPVTGKKFPAARAYYEKSFEQVFEGFINSTTVTKAIGSYERTANSYGAPFDQWLKGDDDAMTADQKEGMLIFFGRGKCFDCHNPPHFSDFDFHNIGGPKAGFETKEQFPHNPEICGGIPAGVDPGRAEVPFLRSSHSDLGRFRSPTLRNVELSGPYMHNGVFQTLEEAVRHYETLAKGFVTPDVGELDPELEGAQIGDGGGKSTDVAQLTAFMRALTGSQFKSPARGIAPPSE
jgi:cytochrome c peroxidase